MAEEIIDDNTPQDGTQQPTSYTKSVYDGLADKFGAKNMLPFDEFSKKISTDKNFAKNTHDALIENYGEKNVEDFNSFYDKVKKNASSTIPTQSTSLVSKSISPSEENNTQPSFNINESLGAPIGQNLVRGDIVNQPKVLKGQPSNTETGEAIQNIQKAKDDAHATALLNTTKNRLKAKGLPDNSGNVVMEMSNVKKDVQNGDLGITYKNGVPYYGTIPKWYNEAQKGFVNTISGITDMIDLASAGLDNQKRADIQKQINQRKDIESRMPNYDLLHPENTINDVINAQKDQTPMADPTAFGKVAGMAGGLAPYMVASSVGIPAKIVMAVSQTAPNEFGEMYNKYKENGEDDATASAHAAKNIWRAAPDAVLNYMLMGENGAKLPTEIPAAKNLLSTISEIGKSATKMGLKADVADLAKMGIETIQGEKPDNIADRLEGKFGSWFLNDALVRGLPMLAGKGIEGIANAPKYLKSAIKEYATRPEVRPIVDEHLKTLPNGDEIKSELDKWEEDRKPLEGVVPEEKMATVNGLNQQVKSLKEQQNKLPEPLKEQIQPQIDAVNGRIEKVVNSSRSPIKYEIDEKTGNKVLQPAETTKPIEEEVNQPIGKAKETKREGKESIVPEHNNIETNPNYRTAYAGNHEGEQEFTHFILNGKKYPIDGNEELLKNNPDAKLDKSKESQTETKKQQTENIKKFNVPLDEGTRNPKGETMQDFVGRVVSQYEKDKSQQPDNSVIVAHSSVLKALKTYEALKDKPLFKNADWDNLTDEQAKAFTDHYTKESTNNGDIEIYDNGKGGKIKIARHGQTEDNLTGKFRNDETNLTAKGIQQAKELGAKLGEKPPKIISSDLPRAIHTANLAMGEIVTPTEKVLPKEETIEQSLKETPKAGSVGGVDVPKLLKVKSFKTDEGNFDIYDTEKDGARGRVDMFTILKDKNGWIVRNAFVPDNLQKKGIATDFYKKMNEASIKATGNPLRSTQQRTLSNGEVVHELTPNAIKLWDSLVRDGFAEKLGEKNYRFLKEQSLKETPETKSITPTVSEPKVGSVGVVDVAKEPMEFSKEIENKYGVIVDLMGKSDKGDLTLSRIEVPKDERSKGIGSKAMEDIIKYADDNGRRIVLTPSTDFGGTSVNRLKEFYKKFGFVENKGSNKDFSTKESMYREPKQSLKETPETKSITPNTETTEQIESGNPPIQPPNGEEKNVANGEEEGSLITKEELSKYEGAKKLFEEEGKTTWNAVVGRAIQRLIKNNPDKSLEDAAKSHVDRLAALYDEGKAINPTAEDLAIINYAKLKTDEKIASLKDWDSDNSTDRINALAKLDELNKDLLKIAKAANPREAGLAFGIRQMLLSMKNGLQIRRMELSKDKGGNKLNESEMAFTREQWAKEKKLLEEKQELEKSAMQERFDAAIKQHEESYAKLLEQKGKVEEGAKIAKKRQDVLKQKGKELADKLRSGIQKGTYSDPFLIGKSLNFIISKVADMVEGGATLAAAIDKFVSDNKIESRRKNVEDAIFNHLDRQSKREDAITKIKEDIDANKSTTITKDMVRSNTIKDFVNSYVNTVPLDQVSDVAFHQLKELLPDITKDKFKEAYLKEGEYKIETEKELRNQSVDEQRRYNRLVEAESKLRELKKTRNLLKEDDFIGKAKVDAEIEKINNKIKDDLINSGQKVSSKSNVDKEELASRATKHNSNIDEVVSDINGKLKNANEKTQDTVNDLLKKLEEAKIDYNKESKLDQTKKVENATEKIDLIQKRLDVVKNSIGKDLAYDIELGLQKVKDRFDAAKQESEQNILLRDAKQDAITKKNETQRRINAGEFDNSTPKKVLTKSDAELVKNQIELGKVQSAYNKKADQLKKDNRKWYGVLGEVGRSAFVNGLIGTPKTFFNLTMASPLKIATTYLSKLTTGKIGDMMFNKGLLTRAKEGGESSSWQSMNEGIRAVFQHTDMKKLDAKIEEDNESFKQIAKKYENEKDPEKKKELKQRADEALRKAVGNTMYKYVGTSVFKTFADKLLHRNSQLESMLGNEHGEEFIPISKIKDYKDVADNISYILGFVGRSHGALKSPSARYHFAAGFMARLEGAMERNEDINNPAKLQEMAADSFTDWNSGMYQQDNWVTNFGNKVIWDLKNSDNHFAKALGHGMSWDVAITKVPVNMINEMIFDMTLGLPTSAIKYAKEVNKAGKLVKAEMPDATKAELKEALREQLSKMDKKTAVDIVRMFRHGGFALGILGLALASKSFKYGGFAHKGQTKEDEKKKEGELKTGELSVGDNVLNKYITSSLTHTTGMFPLLAYLNAQHDFEKYKAADNTDKKAAVKTGVDLLEHIVNTYPQSKIVNPITIAKDTYSNVKSASSRLNKAYNPSYQYDAGTSENTSKEYNYLKEHNESIKDYPIESLHPVDQNGKDIEVTPEKYKEFIKLREEKIKESVSKLMNGDIPYTNENGEQVKLSEEEAKKIPPKQLKGFMMSATEIADKEAMNEIFTGKKKLKEKEYPKLEVE